MEMLSGEPLSRELHRNNSLIMKIDVTEGWNLDLSAIIPNRCPQRSRKGAVMRRDGCPQTLEYAIPYSWQQKNWNG